MALLLLGTRRIASYPTWKQSRFPLTCHQSSTRAPLPRQRFRPRVVLRRSPVANVLYFPFSEAPPITVGGRRKGPVGRRPRCRASRYRVRCRADPVADRSRAGHDGGAKNAGHEPLHDVGQIADALYALLGGAVFVWARSAPRWC